MNSRALEGKSILIIGGTTGLGLAAAAACIAAGACVTLVGRKPDSIQIALQKLGPDARALAGDACDPATADRAIALAVESFGRLDGLYHVAGGSGRSMGDGPLHEITDGGWDATLKLNLTSLFYSNRAAVRRFMAQGGGGTILNMGSVTGFSPSPHFFATHAYAAAKAAIEGYTLSCAAYYAARNIRFNVLAPALTDTPMARRAVGNDQIQAYIRTKQPLDGGRPARPEDADGAAVFFLSDQSRFVTGQVLYIDGGWSVSEGQLPHSEAPHE